MASHGGNIFEMGGQRKKTLSRKRVVKKSRGFATISIIFIKRMPRRSRCAHPRAGVQRVQVALELPRLGASALPPLPPSQVDNDSREPRSTDVPQRVQRTRAELQAPEAVPRAIPGAVAGRVEA